MKTGWNDGQAVTLSRTRPVHLQHWYVKRQRVSGSALALKTNAPVNQRFLVLLTQLQ